MTRSIAIEWSRVEQARDVDPQEQSQIERAKGGDPDAHAWLLNRYRDRVIRLATHILRRPADAEDVAQEAFVKAFKSLHSYRSESSFYTWLYKIVVRVCLNRRRLASWERETQFDLISPAHHSTSCALEAANSKIVVEALLDRLSPSMRAVIVLRELENLEYTEIAETLNIPIGLVKWRLHRARALFQKLWKESGNG